MRRICALLGSASVVAGCGGHHQASPATVRLPIRVVPHRHARGPAKLIFTVADGDTNARVPDAQLRLAHRRVSTGRHGVAVIRVRHRGPLTVTVSARGFGTRSIYESFAASRRVTIRIYQPKLQWPLYGATPARSQAQTHIRLRPPFKTLWEVPVGGLIEFPAVVDDGVAYIGNAQAQIHAISMRFGRVLWTHETAHGEMASSPAVAGNAIVYHSMTGEVFEIDRANGRVRWSYRVGAPIESSPIVIDGVDYFGSWDGRVYALDLRRHKLRWVRTLGAKITSSAAIADRTLYIGDYAGRLWAISPTTGAIRWSRIVNGRIYGTPAVADGRVFVPSSDGDSLSAFSTRGRYLWRVHANGYVYSSPAIWAGRVFFGSYDGDFYAVSAATGAVLWKVATGGPISGAATVVDGIAYVGSFAHRIVGVDATSGHMVVRFPHGQYAPVSGNGMRLLFHGYSDLYAVAPRHAS